MSKKFSCLFQLDPLKELNLETDSTISLIKKAIQMEMNVWITTPNTLSFENQRAKVVAQLIQNTQLKLGSNKQCNLEDFDYYFIRQDPPFDMDYLTNLYILEIHNKSHKKPFFVNNPSGIKNFTEKIFPFYFNDLIPYTVITADVKIFSNMLERFPTVVLKTLYNKGGEGIYKVNNLNEKSKRLFKKITNSFRSQIIIQEFLDDVKSGDKRILLINGKPDGVVNRIPKEGQFKANLHLGGKAERSLLTKKENEICNRLARTLRRQKLFFVGIDVINEKLTEINVTSPTGIVQIESLYKTDFCKVFWQKLLKIN
ncbi:MAG: glutathione synthase [Rickettsiales bacterium]|nr:glutathione synthase [Rickettsiales bacterium]